MSSNVKLVELGQVAEFIRGITFKPDDKVDVFSDGSVVCFRTSNVQEVLDQSDLIAVPKFFVKREEQFVSEGDILVSTANSWNLVGKCSWVPEINYRAAIGGFISILRAKHRLIHPKYLYYWFNSSDIQTLVRSFGRQTTNISNMDVARVLKLHIALPSLAEQQRIAAILDCADALRAKRRAALAKLDELLQATFIEMFGDPVTNPKEWPVRSLSELVQVKTGSTPSRTEAENYGGLIPWVKTGEVNWNTITDTEEKVSELGVKAGKLKIYPKDSVVIAMYGQGTTRGKSAILGIDATVNQACAVLPPSKNVTTAYLAMFLRLSYDALRQLGRGGNQPNLNLDLVGSFSIPVPSIEYQEIFSQIFNFVNAQRNSFIQAQEKQDTLFQSLQQRAFRGDL